MRVRTLGRVAERKGFTLMEVMVVVAILVVLAGVGTVTYLQYQESAMKDAALLGVQTLDKAVQFYKVRYHQYPTSLAVLTQPGQNGEAAALDVKSLTDPWGRQYVYEPQNLHPSTKKPHIYSSGPPDSNVPISNW